jgi:hypothetical protein
MRRSRLVGAAVGLWMLFVVLPAQAVLLRYTPKVGTISSYTVTTAIRNETTSESLPAPLLLQYSGTTRIRVKVLAQTSGGRKVQSSAAGGTVKRVIKGVGATTLKRPDSSLAAIYDDQAYLTQVVSTSTGRASGQSITADNTIYALGVIPFTAEEVKPGDTWTGEIQFPLLLEAPPSSFKATVRLLSVAPYKGRTCAKLRVTYNGDYAVDLSQTPQARARNAQGSSSGTVEGSVIAYYDYADSVWVDASGKVTTTGDATIEAPGRQSMTVSERSVANFKMTLVK